MAVLLLGGCAEVRQVTEFIRGEPPLVGGQVREELADAEDTALDRKIVALWRYLSGQEEGPAVETDELGPLPNLDPVRADAPEPPEPAPTVEATLAEAQPEPEAQRAAPAPDALVLDSAGCPSSAELARFHYESAKRAYRVRSYLEARKEGRQVSLTSCR